MARLRQLLRLYRLYGRMDVQWLLQDTWVCLVVIFSDIVASLSGVSGMFLLSVRFSGVGGFTTDEMLFLVALALLGEGVIFFAFSGFNTSHISRRLGRGQLDNMLIQPIPLWMQLLAESFLPITGSSTMLCGIGLLAVALGRLQLALTPLWWLMLVGFLLARVALTLALNYLVGISAIWQPVACEEISSVMNDLSFTLCRYPLVGLPAPLMLLLETALPIALMVYLPTLALLGKEVDFLTAIWPLAAAILFSCLAAWAFRKGLEKYAKVGSHRYRSMGFRN